MTYDEIMHFFQWAKTNGAVHARVEQVEATFQATATAPEESVRQALRDRAPDDMRRKLDMELWGQSLEKDNA